MGCKFTQDVCFQSKQFIFSIDESRKMEFEAIVERVSPPHEPALHYFINVDPNRQIRSPHDWVEEVLLRAS